MGSIVDDSSMCRELDAAHALLGVSPPSPSSSSACSAAAASRVPLDPIPASRRSSRLQAVVTGASTSTMSSSGHSGECCTTASATTPTEVPPAFSTSSSPIIPPEPSSSSTPVCRRPRSGSFGLDALADIATKETLAEEEASRTKNLVECSTATTTTFSGSSTGNVDPNLVSRHASSDSSDDGDDCDAMMPPPPPRRFLLNDGIGGGRQRSASNPEGMEKWGEGGGRPIGRPGGTRLHLVLPASILEEELAAVSAAMQRRALIKNSYRATTNNINNNNNNNNTHHMSQEGIPEDIEEEVEDQDSAGNASEEKEEDCSGGEEEDEYLVNNPDELLQRARSRLLEDLLEGKMGGGGDNKGVLILPHSLEKYKEIYNKHGRIGIYTPAERAAIIARFQRKRGRRVWNKKIRYNCRKSLADRRLRVKGRFVKRSEQEQLARDLVVTTCHHSQERDDHALDDDDEHMPDVNDPEAGFAPTEDQPYRRLRRHTVT